MVSISNHILWASCYYRPVHALVLTTTHSLLPCQDQALGGWHLKRSVDGGSQQSYKFTAKYVLKAGQEVIVWASGSGKSQNAPTDLVYKNVESWGTGDNVETSLLDASGEVSAATL